MNTSAAHAQVLFGWSRGAFAARDILYEIADKRAPHNLLSRFGSLLIMAASVAPAPDKLKLAGIRRIMFAGGDADGSVPVMKASAAQLRAAGFEVRFVSLGNIAHVWPADFEQRMTSPLAWLTALSDSDAGSP